jgi:signal transduction histidine kinase
MINYSKARNLSFAAYIVFTILFSSFLIYLGKKDVEKISAFAAQEIFYIENLMKCADAFDKTVQSFHDDITNPSSEQILYFEKNFFEFQKRVNLLSGEEHESFIAEKLKKLKKCSYRISSALDAFKKDSGASFEDKQILLDEDRLCIYTTLSECSKIIHSLLFAEYNQAEVWQKQSLFFFHRLQYMLITFFVLMTGFVVFSSFYSGILLKKYLKRLSDGTKQISLGNFEYRFTNLEADEMSDLMRDFNSMARQLQLQTIELKKINKTLEEKAAQLAEANLHKDRFFANMSHELRTPLNSIIGFSELNLARADYTKEKIMDNSRKILLAAEHLLELIRGLLDIAKIDAGILSPNIQQYDISTTINSVIEILKPLADRKNLSFFSENLSPLILSYDEKMIKQVLINIIGNAIKFTKEGQVKVRLKRNTTTAQIEICDSGIGISTEEQKGIFKDFHRVENGLTSNYEGVGLGLALSKRLVELHGGKILLKSEIQKGSSFTVELPVHSGANK